MPSISTQKRDSEKSGILIGTSETARIDPYDFIEGIVLWSILGGNAILKISLVFFKITRCQRSTQFR